MSSNQPTGMNGPNGMMGCHMGSMTNQMHSNGMMNNANNMTSAMPPMNGPVSMNKGGMQQMGIPAATQGTNVYSNPNMGSMPRGRPGPYPNPQQYLSQKRQYNAPGVQQQYNANNVMQSFGPGGQPYNANQVRDRKMTRDVNDY